MEYCKAPTKGDWSLSEEQRASSSFQLPYRSVSYYCEVFESVLVPLELIYFAVCLLSLFLRSLLYTIWLLSRCCMGGSWGECGGLTLFNLTWVWQVVFYRIVLGVRILLLWLIPFWVWFENRYSNWVAGEAFVALEGIRLDSEDVNEVALTEVSHLVVWGEQLTAFSFKIIKSYEVLHCLY